MKILHTTPLSKYERICIRGWFRVQSSEIWMQIAERTTTAWSMVAAMTLTNTASMVTTIKENTSRCSAPLGATFFVVCIILFCGEPNTTRFLQRSVCTHALGCWTPPRDGRHSIYSRWALGPPTKHSACLPKLDNTALTSTSPSFLF